MKKLIKFITKRKPVSILDVVKINNGRIESIDSNYSFMDEEGILYLHLDIIGCECYYNNNSTMTMHRTRYSYSCSSIDTTYHCIDKQTIINNALINKCGNINTEKTKTKYILYLGDNSRIMMREISKISENLPNIHTLDEAKKYKYPLKLIENFEEYENFYKSIYDIDAWGLIKVTNKMKELGFEDKDISTFAHKITDIVKYNTMIALANDASDELLHYLFEKIFIKE